MSHQPQVTQTVGTHPAFERYLMVEYVAPKKVCPTWYYILSHLAFEWKNGNETGLYSEKQSNPWAVWVERSIDQHT